jgi:hypothetical protein
MEINMVHFVASDAHDTELRPPDLRQAWKHVKVEYGADVAQRLFVDYPLIAIAGDYIDCADPEETEQKGPWFELCRFDRAASVKVRSGLCGFLNLAVANARCARANPLRRAGNHRAHRLQIDIPAALRHVMSVADFVAELGTFTANIANSCHETGNS